MTFDKVEAVATALVSGVYEKAAAILKIDVSTLRIWRREPKILARVKQLRQQLNDERLARYCSMDKEVGEEHFKLIFSKGIAPPTKLAAIDLYYRNLQALQDRAAEADAEVAASAEIDRMNAEFETQWR